MPGDIDTPLRHEEMVTTLETSSLSPAHPGGCRTFRPGKYDKKSNGDQMSEKNTRMAQHQPRLGYEEFQQDLA